MLVAIQNSLHWGIQFLVAVFLFDVSECVLEPISDAKVYYIHLLLDSEKRV